MKHEHDQDESLGLSHDRFQDLDWYLELNISPDNHYHSHKWPLLLCNKNRFFFFFVQVQPKVTETRGTLSRSLFLVVYVTIIRRIYSKVTTALPP